MQMTRRQFNRLFAGLALAGVGTPITTPAAFRLAIGSAQRDWLAATLPTVDRHFDPFAKMLVASADSISGNEDQPDRRTGSVHPTRASLNYAIALLDAGDPARVNRANEILRVIIGLQDRNSSNPTFGLWPWCLEEPVESLSPHDLDEADYCAVPLLMAWTLNRDRIAVELREPLRDAILDAAQSIQRRGGAPSRNRTAIHRTSVLLLAAQEFKVPSLRTHAKERLRTLHSAITRQDFLSEYNSPPDLAIALQELARLLWLLKDSRDVALIRELHDFTWRQVSTHFHAPTRQWAGPHSRNDETDLRRQPSILALLQQATGKPGSLGLPEPLPLSLENYRLPVACPRKFLRHFTHLEQPRQMIAVVAQANPATDGARNPVAGTTWLHPRFTLGTRNRSDLAARSRPFVAYWGTAAAPRFLRLRLLKDGNDVSSGLLFCVQHEGSALAVATFSADTGTPAFTTKDLRLRLEFGGELAGCTVQTVGEETKSIVIQDRDTRFIVRPVLAKFGQETPRWDFPELSLAKHLDAVLRAGESKTIDLRQTAEAFVCFAFEEWPYAQREFPSAKIETQLNAGQLRARWAAPKVTLDLIAPILPSTHAMMSDNFRSHVS